LHFPFSIAIFVFMPLDLPEAFTTRMQAQLGAAYADFIDALNDRPVISLRTNPQKPGVEFTDGTPIPWNAHGIYLPERPQFFKDPLIYSGAYYVQEASSMLIAQMANMEPGMRILDLCAAPGGKTTLLASQLAEDSLLLSNEVVGNRARVLHEVVTRWGDPRVAVSCNHPRDFSALHNFFDLIVVDAPCSGEGMFRKDPDVIKVWKPSLVQQCADRQREILSHVLPALKPGGRLIYSTCTYNEQENEEIVQWLLDHDPGMMRIVPHEFPADWGLTPGSTDGFDANMRFTFRCFPHRVRGEGFFLAGLEKLRAGKETGKASRSAKKSRSGKGKKGKNEGQRPARELKKADLLAAGKLLREADSYELVANEQTVEAIPRSIFQDIETLRGRLRLIKTGIALGIPRKGQVQPDHGLAMSERTSEAVPTIELDQGQALRYLSRDELDMDTGDIRGWAIVRYQGRNLGWVKVLDKRVNNHLPRHLKIRTDVSELY
jgi:16S rRNA C967 or C1407 C5-methylase (RsmB/RsmF family)/NOL1/NOP2/fmu family ribosome biogenesis protein